MYVLCDCTTGLLFGKKAERLPVAIKVLSILLDISLSDRFHYMSYYKGYIGETDCKPFPLCIQE